MSEVDDGLVAQLVEMGFQSEDAATALLVHDNNLGLAIEWYHPLLLSYLSSIIEQNLASHSLDHFLDI